MLHFGASVDCIDHKGFTPLHYAVKSGSLQVIIELIEKGADVNHRAKWKLEDGCVVDKTPLFRARSYEIVKFLMQKGAKPNMKATVVAKQPKTRAIDYLLEYNPDAAKAIFDEGLEIDKEGNLIMNFEVFHNEEHPGGEMALLSKVEEQSSVSVVDDAQVKKLLILHPLLQIFLYLKFKTIRPQYWFLLLFQIAFVITLTSIGIVHVQFTSCENDTEDGAIFQNRYFTAQKKYLAADEDMTDLLNTTATSSRLIKSGFTKSNVSLFCNKKSIIADHPNESTCVLRDICKAYYSKDTSLTACWTTYWLFICTIIMLVLHILKEIFEVASKKTVMYVFSLENILEFTILACAIIFLWSSHYDTELAYHTSAWMIFLAWIDLVLYVGRMSFVGKYIFMSLYVIRILTLCLLAYSPLFMAFTFAYYILFQSNEKFNGYYRGMQQVLAMMIDEISFEQFDHNHVKEIGMTYSVQIMTILFMVFMSLILMNLLIAITVNNTELLKERGQIMISYRKIEELKEVVHYREHWLFQKLSGISNEGKKEGLRFLKRIGKPVLADIHDKKLVIFFLWFFTSRNQCYFFIGLLQDN